MGILQTVTGVVDTARISVGAVAGAFSGGQAAVAADRRLSWWSEKLLRDAKIDLVVRDRENAGDGSEPFVVVSNHQSLFDIPVLFRAIPGRLRMVAKAELFRIPLWGPAMQASGFIRLDRHDPNQAVRALRTHGASLLAEGTRVWIAPEGTRSASGAVGPFKTGGFHLALNGGVRILPVAIAGTRDVLPVGGVAIRTGKRVTVSVLPPVDPARYGAEGVGQLRDAVRQQIVARLSQANA